MIDLEYAALMHDIGRITLNEPAILRAGYTDDDIARWGAQIVRESPYLETVATIVRDQHRPYRHPGQLTDETMSIAAKIIRIASAYDQLTQEEELSPLDALEELHQRSAYDYDPAVLGSLRRVLASQGLIPS